MLTLGSLFDGIGGWQLAALHNGIKPVWSSEIEKFPLAVTRIRFPNTTQLGDVRQIDGGKITPVDIICAGSPCQGLSVANGARKGLADEKSGLFGQAIRIIREMRNATDGKYPRFFAWENVPGCFSSNRGADFRAVLEEISATEIPIPQSKKWAECGLVRGESCEIAWRCLDAQYSLPQRRKRIFLVANFRERGRCAGEILFKPEGLRGDFAPSQDTRKELPPVLKAALEVQAKM